MTATPQDLFDTDSPPTEIKAAPRWLMVTNQRNLLYMLAAGMIMPPKGFGKKYYQDALSGFPGWIPLFADEIAELVDHGGLVPGNVTILSPGRFENSCVVELPDKMNRQIDVLDEYSLKYFPGGKIGFAEIDNFKGLENEAVIVVDLPAPTGEDRGLAAHYVAMSRARPVLSLIYRSKQ